MKTRLLIAIMFLVLSSSTLGVPSRRLPFINDNFGKALTEAKQRNVPLFVDVWAPW